MNRFAGLPAVFLAVAIGAIGCSGTTHVNSSQHSISNGRSIFQTGHDSNGTQIMAQRPPLYPRCAACHQADGSGGLHLPGGVVSADLRHSALVTDQKHPYTIRLVERAISTGIDNDGQPLNPLMPRWRLSRRDLHDVAYYVLTQLK